MNYPIYKSFLIILFLSCIAFTSCQSGNNEESATRNMQSDKMELNPAMEGFNFNDSDAKAIAIADEVMEAIGGRKNWDETNYLVWDFFGKRRLYWDKMKGDVRIEFLNEELTILLNIHTMEGKVAKNGIEFTNADSLTTYLDKGKGIWINDSYWLVMPFKLKDSGVTLKYIREDTLSGGIGADVLQLTFENVGNTPENKYEVYVDKNDNLIKQWAFFRNFDQDSANFVRPWDNYQSYGKILLSSERSDNGGPSNTSAPESLPSKIFTSFDEVDLTAGD